jgi:hypothetical protein
MNALPKNILAAVVAAGLAALAGCATDYHYSQIDGYRYYKAPIDTHPLIISKIDGVSTLPSAPVRVDPGPHRVAVQTYPSKIDSRGEERAIDLDVKPCTHYYLVAVKPNALMRDFDVKVEYEEPVPGCTPPSAK